MQKKEITKAKSRYFINAGLVIVLGLVLLPREVRAASHALLIGIGDYSRSGIESLSGPPNDVTIMRDVLMRRFAVPESNIMVLRDSQATHSKISAAFGELAERIKAGDFVYIQYSGHGSYTPDPSQRSGPEETWGTVGSRSRKADKLEDQGLDDYDVLDKEIRQWLVRLYVKTNDVVFVSDSCHSATVSRGLFKGVRAAPPDPR